MSVLMKVLMTVVFLAASWGLWKKKFNATSFMAICAGALVLYLLVQIPVDSITKVAVGSFELERKIETAEDLLKRLENVEKRISDASTLSFLNTASQCDGAAVKRWIESGLISRDLLSRAFLMAVNCGRGKLDEELLEIDRSIVTSVDDDGNSALHLLGSQDLWDRRWQQSGCRESFFVFNRVLDVRAKRFIDGGLDPDKKNSAGQTPLMTALYKRIRVPVQGAQRPLCEPIGHEFRRTELPRFLLQNGANLKERDGDGWTTVMYAAAAYYDTDDVVASLSEVIGNVDQVSSRAKRLTANQFVDAGEGRGPERPIITWPPGVTALMIASRIGSPTSVKELLCAGAKVSNVDDSGNSVTDHAGEHPKEDEREQILAFLAAAKKGKGGIDCGKRQPN